MHFGRLTVHFVTKIRRVCANFALRCAQTYVRLFRKRYLVALVSVPLEEAAPIFVRAVANVERLARALRRRTNGAKERTILLSPADDLHVVLHETRGSVDEGTRQLAGGRQQNQRNDSAFDYTFRGRNVRRRLCRVPSSQRLG